MTKAMAPAADEIFTLDEVSAFLKAGKRTVYRLAQSGEIPAFKLGGTGRFRRSELDRWIAAQIAAKGQENSSDDDRCNFQQFANSRCAGSLPCWLDPAMPFSSVPPTRWASTEFSSSTRGFSKTPKFGGFGTSKSSE